MFENLIGNEKAKQILNNIIEPTHAYMFTGPEGIGKSLFAKEFANKFLCISENKPCFHCKSCLQFADKSHMDFKLIEPVENSIKIEQNRAMIEKIYEKPITSDKKIYIINNAEKMTTQAQNCLLKILEEPPKNIIIILIVSNEQAMLNTIKSRCIKIKFDKIAEEELKNYLKEKDINITENMLQMYQGSIGRALTLQINEEKYESLNKILESNSKIEYMQIAKIIYEDKDNIINYLEYMNTLFYCELKQQGSDNQVTENLNYTKCIDAVNDTIAKLGYNCNIEMTLDQLMLEIWQLV